MVLYDSSNHIVAYATMNDVNRNPDQILQFTNTTASTGFSLAIFTNGGSTVPGQFKYIVYGQGTTINDPHAGKGSGTLIGHEEVAAANTVGAVAYTQTAAYGGKNAVESFSSVGPGSLLFDANGNRLAQATSSGGVDFIAPDGAATNVFNPFYGTSAAAPNAAAVAALMLQANHTLTPAQVSADLQASTIGASGGASAAGAGLIQAPAAVKLALASKPSVATSTLATLAATPTTVSSALGLVNADPSATADFYASLDPQAAAWAPDAAPPVAASTAALAMLNNLNFGVPVLTDPNPLGA